MTETVGVTGKPAKGARVGVVADPERDPGAGAALELELEGRRDPFLSLETTYPPVARIGFGPGAGRVAGDGM